MPELAPVTSATLPASGVSIPPPVLARPDVAGRGV